MNIISIRIARKLHAVALKHNLVDDLIPANIRRKVLKRHFRPQMQMRMLNAGSEQSGKNVFVYFFDNLLLNPDFPIRLKK